MMANSSKMFLKYNIIQLYLSFFLEDEQICRTGLVMRSTRLLARWVDDPASKDDGIRSSRTKRNCLKYPTTVER